MSFTNKAAFLSPTSPENGASALDGADWDLSTDVFPCCYDGSLSERHLAILRSQQEAMELRLEQPYLDRGQLDYTENHDGNVSPPESRRKLRPAVPRTRFEIVSELGPEEVRWCYKEDKKTWKPFVGHDSLKIELMYRKLCELNPNSDGGDACPAVSSEMTSEPTDQVDLDGNINIEAVCVRGGLYEVDVRDRECYPVYWNRESD